MSPTSRLPGVPLSRSASLLGLCLALAAPAQAEPRFTGIAFPNPTGLGPYGSVAADLNGDGTLDLATTNQYGHSVSVLLGKPGGGFKAKRDYATGKGPTGLRAVDCNGDKIQDLISVNYDDNTVSVLLGQGDGSFLPAKTQAGGERAFALAVADLNGDGRPDLALPTNPTTGASVAILLGQGDGSFKFKRSLFQGGQVGSVVAADLNKDGSVDLALADWSQDRVSVLLGRGDSRFQAVKHYPAALPWSVAAADFDGDGNIDLATVGNTDNGLSILPGKGDGGFQAKTGYPLRGDVLAADDLNGDGRPDLAVAGNGNTLAVLLNQDGHFQSQPTRYNVDDGYNNDYNGHYSILAADLDGDGKTDLATPNWIYDNLSILVGRGDGGFKPQLAKGVYPVSSGPSANNFGVSSELLADIDGDGHLDVVTANLGSDSISVLLGKGDGKLRGKMDSATGPTPVGIAAGDFNGDGKTDLATANQGGNGSVSVLLGKGNGNFKPRKDYAPGGEALRSALSLAAADLNGDGKIDLAVNGYYSLALLLGQGDGSFQALPDIAAPGNDGRITVADLNLDGKPDIVGPGWMMTGLGSGAFGKIKEFYPYCGACTSVAVADLNGDGKPDIAMDYSESLAPTTSFVLVMLGDGTGNFQPPVQYHTGWCPTGVKVADLDADGKPDLATANFCDRTVSVLAGNGDGGFQPKRDFKTGYVPGDLALGDLDGDGKPEAITANPFADTVSVLLNQSRP
ncbi:FG-GAP repeat domain-containing protein [Methylomagnum ishizawai]|uniref:FG-GAP repeat domain-containing protein n=1 Tax=Methylomagnum ishizawai TaxID=1760988 RepID=UPI001C3240CE|nr:VCBS repeat-containing protein [Methylomagnum ishizawai]BBL74230.1 hypothetical protein MishRS11D_13280 [Methylomagnum ishizawai]